MIIDRHLLREFAMPFLLVVTILLIIFVGYSLSSFLTQADAGLLNTDEVIRLTFLKALIALEVLLPIALFFGLMLGLGALHSNSQIVAMQASGIGELGILRPILTLAIPLALLIGVLSIFVRPWAYTQTYAMLAMAEASSDIDRIKAGQFYLTHSDTAASSGTSRTQEAVGEKEEDWERAVFIEKILDDQALEQVFIRTRVDDELQVISSKTGFLVEKPLSDFHTLELDDARIFKRVNDGPDLFARIGHFTLRIESAELEPPRYKAKSIATSVLKNSQNPKDMAEYQWRLSTSITAVLLALLALPLSRSKPRQGRYAKLLLAFLVYAAYYNLIAVSRTWVEQQASTSIWWAPCLLALLVSLCYLPWHSLKCTFDRLRK